MKILAATERGAYMSQEVHDKERDMYVCLNLEQMKPLIKDLTVMADLIHPEKTPTIRFD